jgi:PPM family protein phosphatase
MGLSIPFTRHPESATTDTPSIPTRRPPLNVDSYGLSDCGQVRSSNEDCFLIAELARTLQVHHTNLPQSKATFSCHRGHVFLVADGVGGHKAGEVASGLTVKNIEDFLLNTLKRFSNLQANEEQGALRELQNALFQADSRIFEETAKHPEWLGMGTTLTMAFAVNWRLFVAHAGDSRCYLHSGGRLQQITQDHTMTAEMVRQGILSSQDQANHPWRHVVTNIIGGSEPEVRVELHSLDLHVADTILLCSDGLTNMVSAEQIAAILQEQINPRRACECLVSDANKQGGNDNITAIVAQFRSDSSHQRT